MNKKTLIAPFVTVIIFIIISAANCIFSLSYAKVNKPQTENTSERIKVSDYIKSYQLNNDSISSKNSLNKGFKLLFNQVPNKKGISYVPNINIKFKNELSFIGYVMDKYNIIFARAGVFPPFADKGKEVTFYWDQANGMYNDYYYFYIEIYDYNKYLFSLKSAPIKINIRGGDYPSGFYIVSPPISSPTEGLDFNMSFNKKPQIAWFDTENKDVLMYQLFDGGAEPNNVSNPLINNIDPKSRCISINRDLLPSKEKAKKEQDMGQYNFVVRALFKNGTHKDTEASGPLIIEEFHPNVFDLINKNVK